MWQPHLHHNVHHPSSRPHPIAHHYHMSLPRPDDVIRTALSDRPMYPPSDRRDPSEQYAHRHRASYPPPPMMHPPVPGHFGNSWKNPHYEGQGLESVRHEETRRMNPVDLSKSTEQGELPPVTKMERSNHPEETSVQSADKTATSAAQIVTVNGKEERATPGSTMKAAAILEEKFQQSLKSPVTMCFERFLGAGKCFSTHILCLHAFS